MLSLGPEKESSAPSLKKGSIPGALYGLTADTPTIGTDAIVLTSANENTKAVAAFARAIIAQIGDLKKRHPALASRTVEEMIGGSDLPIPRHPAASQVYKQLGLLK